MNGAPIALLLAIVPEWAVIESTSRVGMTLGIARDAPSPNATCIGDSETLVQGAHSSSLGWTDGGTEPLDVPTLVASTWDGSLSMVILDQWCVWPDGYSYRVSTTWGDGLLSVRQSGGVTTLRLLRGVSGQEWGIGDVVARE